ncbi:MAG: site-specific recombinase, partial [Solimonas sp.]
ALDDALQRLAVADEAQRLSALRAVIAAVRPARPELTQVARAQLQNLTQRMREHPAQRAALREALLWLLGTRQPLRLLTESGVLAQESLFAALWRRLTDRVLPEEWRPAELKDCLHYLFDDTRDHVWVDAVDDAVWIALLDALDFLAVGGQRARMTLPILEALQVVSYRIAAIGLEPELVRNHPAIERYESPFLMQNVELRDFLEERKKAAVEQRAPTIDDRHLLVLLEQCGEIVGKVRRQAAQTGASISLTVLLVRLSQNLERLRLLLRLLETRPAHELNGLRVGFFKALVRAENQRNSVRQMWREISELLAARITENASKTGEHYVTATRREYFDMLRAALGAGFIVPFMALLKIAMGASPHSPLATAILYSLNYGLGFVLIYLLHFTIATKQPAMTASYLAASIASADGRDRLAPLVEQIVRTLRTQFVAIFGNVVFAFAIPVALATAVQLNTGEPLLRPEKAAHLLHDQHPFASLAWPHAAIAGVCLFLVGLISGYFDNKAVYNRIPQRLQQVRALRRLLGPARLARLAAYLENNLGALAGNFFFGCMLGSMGTLGFIVGLPLDIRHVTFSSSYVGYSLVALDWHVGWRYGAALALGVIGIGLINLTVSFTLALRVALRAQRVRFEDRRALLRTLGHRFINRPGDFFWPPREAEGAAGDRRRAP